MYVGLYEGSKSWSIAEKDGLKVATAYDAAQADIIMILVNDEKQPVLYKESIEPNLKKEKHWHLLTVLIFIMDKSLAHLNM